MPREGSTITTLVPQRVDFQVLHGVVLHGSFKVGVIHIADIDVTAIAAIVRNKVGKVEVSYTTTETTVT